MKLNEAIDILESLINKKDGLNIHFIINNI